jgi:hypothetical protein
MLANFLEKSKPINFIIYLGLFFCFFFINLFSTHFATTFTWIIAIESVSFMMLWSVIFFFFNFVVSKNNLTFSHSYAFFLFVLASLLFISKLFEFKILILLLIHLLFLRKVYSLRSPKRVLKKLFDCGFWLGILCLLEPFSIVFYSLLLAATFLQQKITAHTLITPIIGFITPLILLFTYLFWNDTLEEFTQRFNFDIYENAFIFAEEATIWIFCVIISLTLFSIFLKSPKVLSVNNSFKKSWLLLIINTLIAVVFAFVITKKNGSEIVFLLLPSSIIIANGFEVIQSKRLKDILFSLLFIGTILSFLNISIF